MRGIASMILIMGAGLSACGGGASTGPVDPAVGVFVLTTVNGLSLPYVPPRAALSSYKGLTVTPADALVSDQYEIKADSTYSEHMTIRDSRFGNALRDYLETGVWLRAGNQLLLMIRTSPNSSGNYDFTLNGSTMVTSLESEELVTYTYQKR